MGPGRALEDARLFPLSALYAAVLMTILVGHEMGHYLTCRRYGARATLPYFLPGPPFLGTFGAFIRIKSPLLFKRQVFDVGANGPLAGFALTVPALAAGLALSRVAPFTPTAGDHQLRRTAPVQAPERPLLRPDPGGLGASSCIRSAGPAGSGCWSRPSTWSRSASSTAGTSPTPSSAGTPGSCPGLMVVFLVVMGVFFHTTWLVAAALVLFFEFKIEVPPAPSARRRRERAARREAAALGPPRPRDLRPVLHSGAGRGLRSDRSHQGLRYERTYSHNLWKCCG
ncbi:MAG: site-2 protease family protein [Ignavibacteriales bacterium]|nr:site-2 protease family protein [Ignavibacteriales bacterium]